MVNKANTISSKQLIFIIIGVQMATGILSLPRVVSAETGQDAWIAVLIGAMAPLLSLFLIERTGRRMPDLNFVEINHLLLGKIVGFCMPLLFIVYLVVFAAIIIRLFSEITNIYLLPETPLPVILFLTVFSVVYIASKGSRVVARMNELLFYIFLISLFLLIMPVYCCSEYTNLLPVGETGISGLGRGIAVTSYSYALVEIVLVFYYLVDCKDEIMKAGIMAISITTGIYTVVTIVCLLVYGVEIMQNILWPVIVLLKVVELPVIERAEFFFMAMWLGLGARPVVNTSFAAALTLNQMLKIDVNKYLHYIVMGMGIAIYILALFPADILAVFEWADYAGLSFFAFGIAYPLILYLTAFLRGKKVQDFA